MNKAKFLLCLGTALTVTASPVFAETDTKPAASADTEVGLRDIIVTARRQTERLQDVPVAVSVLSPQLLEGKGTFSPVNLGQTVPGLSVTASIGDRNNLTYTIRGQGYSYGTLFPAVITYYNEVPITQMTTGQFFDLENIQVLRGPQGVSFGRVTDGGNVMVAPKRPTQRLEGSLEVKGGNYNSRVVDAMLNVPVIAGKLAIRGAVEIARRDGFTQNIATGQDLDNVHYDSYRVGVLFTPVSGIENYTSFAYQKTSDNGTATVASAYNAAALGSSFGNVIGLFPFAYGLDGKGNIVPAGQAVTQLTNPDGTPNVAAYVGSIAGQIGAQNVRGPRAVATTSPSFDRRTNVYLTNTLTVDLTDTIQLKNVLGYTHVIDDEASNFVGLNGNVIENCHSACGGGLPFNDQKQYSAELRLSGKSLGNKLVWSVGGYMDEQKPGGQFENDGINVGILQRVGVSYATTKSRAVYGAVEYEVLPKLKLNGGLRYTHDTVVDDQATYLRPIDAPGAQASLAAVLAGPFGAFLGGPYTSAQAAAVAAGTFSPIPHGKCVSGQGGAFGVSNCAHYEAAFNATTWQAGASYQLDRGQLIYAKVSRGYRPGGVNGTAPAGVNPSYSPEYDVSVEVGAKADFHFDNGVSLRTNLALYRDRYTSIQKNVVLPGTVAVSLTEPVDDAVIQGVEFEGTLVPVPGLTLGTNMAYTDAKYDTDPRSTTSDPRACDPTATALTGFCPANRFNAVPKFSYSLVADYTLPLDESLGKISLGGVYFHQSSIATNDTSALNPASIEKAYGTLDIHANWKHVMNSAVDIGFFMTNVTDKTYRIGTNDLTQRSSVGAASSIYGAPRMYGLSVKYSFGK